MRRGRRQPHSGGVWYSTSYVRKRGSNAGVKIKSGNFDLCFMAQDSICCVRDRKVVIANARLMALAPRMLKALRALVPEKDLPRNELQRIMRWETPAQKEARAVLHDAEVQP